MVWPNQSTRDTHGGLASLMEAAQAGDRAAYDRLLRACDPLVRRIARSTGVPAHHVDDAVQETLITLHNARHTFDPGRSFEAWLTTIAQRRSIDLLRRIGRIGHREVHAPVDLDTHQDNAADPAAALAQREEARNLRRAVAELSPVQREAIEHLAIGEQALSEASAQTGRSTTALKVNLHRAIKVLRKRLRTEGEPERDARERTASGENTNV